MRLSDLIRRSAAAVALDTAGADAGQDPEILGLSVDSRQVEPGFLFAALPGGRADGRDFIGDALARGAVAVLTGADDAGRGRRTDSPTLVAENPRHALALLAAAFHGAQPEAIAAVTGTNGKTSTVQFLRQIWAANDIAAASIGTLGVATNTRTISGALTTPDPVALHRLLAELAADHVTHAALEASSHGLDQSRLDGVRVRAAGFTNLTHDHLDYHGTAQAYLAAKTRLFSEVLEENGTAVLNRDSDAYETLDAVCRKRGVRRLSYGAGSGELRLVESTPHHKGQHLVVDLIGHRVTVDVPLVGAFQWANLLCAAGLALGLGLGPEAVGRSLAAITGVRGRMEAVAARANGAAVFVDYAHTPDALENALIALRPHTRGRLFVVFGCGGDRDPAKRPLMGAIAARLADRVIITDDNPRTEPAERIRAEIAAASPGAETVPGRAEAIQRAISAMTAGDVLLIAGKGHETGQIVGERVFPFDDAEVARRMVMEACG